MKKSLFYSLVLTTAFLLSPWATAKDDVPPSVVVYTPSDYAQFLGLTQQQYMNLSSAMMVNPEAKVGFQYESIRENPAYIEQINLLKAGQAVPPKLQREVKALFRKNMNKLADFVGVPRSRINGIVSKYTHMVNTVNTLETIRLARQSGENFTIQDEIEVIVITAPEDKIHTTSSGIYTLYTSQIWDFGVEVGGGSQVNVKVEFVNSANGTVFGSQTWSVNRFAAAPSENLECVSSDCKLVPF